MKVKACCLVLAVVLAVLASPFTVEASLVGFNHDWNLGGFHASYGGGGDDASAWGNFSLESPAH